jgi:Filamentous haemagglutinin family outer membrane protein
MMPSPQGQLGLFAGGNIVGTTIGMMDADPGLLPGLFSSFSTPDGLVAQSGVIFGLPIVLSSTTDITLAQQYNKNPTHAKDPEPVYLYAEGNIGSSERGVTLFASKQARIFAGQDIINMMFFGQNLNATDITRVVAGRDIIGTPQLLQPQAILANNAFGVVGTPEPAIEGNTFVIGGPGDFILEAGRNLGPFMPSVNVDSQYGTLISGEPANVSVQQSFGGGIISVGNQWNPYLPAAGASLTVMFGVGKGEDLNALRDTYVAPGTAANALGGYSATLLSWMQQNEAAELMTEFGTTNVTVDQAYAAFVALPEVRQEVFLIRDVYFNELRATADTSSPSYKEYSRGYAAVNTLFPASLGYTANNLTGGLGSSGALVTTGDLDLRLATIQTQQGGDINILGPGGRVVAGSTVATAAQAARRTSDDARLYSGGVAPYGVPAEIESIPTGYEGVLTLRGGNIDTFTDSDFILNQSRLFTEQGGNILMWSSNGDLNAGQGPKTSANFPPIVVHVDQNGVVTVDQVGGVTGAGIASLQTTPDSPPGDVFLIAPRGTVDAGDAGVRVSGNLSVAALFVVNADNFKVQGATVGIPTVVGPNIGALTTASNATGAAAKTAEPSKSDGGRDTPSVIIVEVLGYGGESEQDSQPGEQQQRKRDGKQSYNLDSPVQVIGTGDLTTTQKKQLTEGEQQEYDAR